LICLFNADSALLNLAQLKITNGWSYILKQSVSTSGVIVPVLEKLNENKPPLRFCTNNVRLAP
jgi:hypothetical protein